MERKAIVKNEAGLHARPAGILVKKANGYKSQIEIIFNGKKVSAKSIMGIMSLGLFKGSEIIVSAKGEDAVEAVNTLVELIEDGFGEI